jgi:hypothetical protein
LAADEAILRVVTVSVRTSVSINIGRRVVVIVEAEPVVVEALLVVNETSIILSSIIESAIVLFAWN